MRKREKLAERRERTHVRKCREAELAARAFTMRKERHSYREIALELGIGQHMVRKLVENVLVDYNLTIAESVDEVRRLELELLDDMARGHLDKAKLGDAQSTEAMLKIMERRSKLLGLDVPKQHIVMPATAGDVNVMSDQDLIKLLKMPPRRIAWEEEAAAKAVPEPEPPKPKMKHPDAESMMIWEGCKGRLHEDRKALAKEMSEKIGRYLSREQLSLTISKVNRYMMKKAKALEAIDNGSANGEIDCGLRGGPRSSGEQQIEAGEEAIGAAAASRSDAGGDGGGEDAASSQNGSANEP
jgi:hypothetical protein